MMKKQWRSPSISVVSLTELKGGKGMVITFPPAFIKGAMCFFEMNQSRGRMKIMI